LSNESSLSSIGKCAYTVDRFLKKRNAVLRSGNMVLWLAIWLFHSPASLLNERLTYERGSVSKSMRELSPAVFWRDIVIEFCIITNSLGVSNYSLSQVM
jgi:hypothetical protein